MFQSSFVLLLLMDQRLEQAKSTITPDPQTDIDGQDKYLIWLFQGTLTPRQSNDWLHCKGLAVLQTLVQRAAWSWGGWLAAPTPWQITWQTSLPASLERGRI